MVADDQPAAFSRGARRRCRGIRRVEHAVRTRRAGADQQASGLRHPGGPVRTHVPQSGSVLPRQQLAPAGGHAGHRQARRDDGRQGPARGWRQGGGHRADRRSRPQCQQPQQPVADGRQHVHRSVPGPRHDVRSHLASGRGDRTHPVAQRAHARVRSRLRLWRRTAQGHRALRPRAHREPRAAHEAPHRAWRALRGPAAQSRRQRDHRRPAQRREHDDRRAAGRRHHVPQQVRRPRRTAIGACRPRRCSRRRASSPPGTTSG